MENLKIEVNKKNQEVQNILPLAEDLLKQAQKLFETGKNFLGEKISEPLEEAKRLAEQALNHVNFILGRAAEAEDEAKRKVIDLQEKIKKLISEIESKKNNN